MKELRRDAKLAEVARKKKAEEEAEKKLRSEYLLSLRENRKFQKYVIEGIIRKGLDELSDLSMIPNANFDNLEEVGRLVMQSKIARAKLQSILSQILD